MKNKPVVRWSVKYVMVSVLVVLNLWFLFECVLYAQSKGYSWQRAWLVNVIINLCVDVLFNNVTEVLLLHYLIPSSINAEAASISGILEELVNRIYMDGGGRHDPDSFSAPEYFFVSVAVARRMPELLESVFVRSYVNHFPQKKLLSELDRLEADAQMEQQQQKERMQRRMIGGFATTMAVALIWLLQYLGSNHMLVQRLILHIAQPLVVGAITIVITSLASTAANAIGLGLAVGSILVVGLWWLLTSPRCRSKFTPRGKVTRRRCFPVPVAVSKEVETRDTSERQLQQMDAEANIESHSVLIGAQTGELHLAPEAASDDDERENERRGRGRGRRGTRSKKKMLKALRKISNEGVEGSNQNDGEKEGGCDKREDEWNGSAGVLLPSKVVRWKQKKRVDSEESDRRDEDGGNEDEEEEVSGGVKAGVQVKDDDSMCSDTPLNRWLEELEADSDIHSDSDDSDSDSDSSMLLKILATTSRKKDSVF
jgi:hypothetical protein